MNDEVQKLIDKANAILASTGSGPGIRYPKKLKSIIASLVNDYGLSVSEVTKNIPISNFSAREWPKRPTKSFKKISLEKGPTKKSMTINKDKTSMMIILSLQVLLLAFQLFLHSILPSS